MNYSQELSTGPVSSKRIQITKEKIQFGDAVIATKDITGFRFIQTINKINGIRVSTAFEIHLGQRNEKDEFSIRFAGVAGSTANMEKQYSRIIDYLWDVAGNRILNEFYKTLLEGGSVKIDNCTLTPSGVVIEKFKLFGKNAEHLVKWEDIDYGMTMGGFLSIKSLGENGVSTNLNSGATLNVVILYSLLKWLYDDSDRIASIYQANGIEF